MNADEQACPYCLESIKAGAIRCKHCHANLRVAPTSLPANLPISTPAPSLPSAPLTPPVSISEWETLDLMTSLVEKSLIVYEEDQTGMSRYRLLETVRLYARERLLESGEGDRCRLQHQNYYLSLSITALSALFGSEQARWLERLEIEHDNLRAALDGSCEQPERIEAGLEMANALGRFWEIRGHLREARDRLQDLLAHAGDGLPLALRAQALNELGLKAKLLGEYEIACDSYETSLALRRQIGDERGAGDVLNNLGLLAKDQGDLDSAERLLNECLAIDRRLGRRYREATCLGNLGTVARQQGRLRQAQDYYEQALEIHQEQKNEHGIAMILNCLGNLYSDLGEYERARASYEACLEIQRRLGDRPGLVILLHGYAALAYASGQYEHAARLFAALLRQVESVGLAMPPAIRKEVERTLHDLADHLGEEAYAMAMQKGQNMNFEADWQTLLS